MRYRDAEQAFSARRAGAVGFGMWGLRRLRLLGFDDKRPAVLGDAVDGVKQLSHGGDERGLRRFACGAEALVEDAQPWIAAPAPSTGIQSSLRRRAFPIGAIVARVRPDFLPDCLRPGTTPT